MIWRGEKERDGEVRCRLGLSPSSTSTHFILHCLIRYVTYCDMCDTLCLAVGGDDDGVGVGDGDDNRVLLIFMSRDLVTLQTQIRFHSYNGQIPTVLLFGLKLI